MKDSLSKFDIREITLAVVDDNPAARETVTGELEDLGMRVSALEGPFYSEEQAFVASKNSAEALICDHHLSQHDYARFTGAELVAKCYLEHFPAILVTKYSVDVIEEIRPYRHLIPALLSPQELTDNIDNLKYVLDLCMMEVFMGKYSSERKPWRTLIRVEDIDEARENAFLIIPAWDAPNGENGIKIPMSMIPTKFQTSLSPKTRFYARVNLGTSKHEDLYIKDFEFKS